MEELQCRGYTGNVPIYCAHDKVVPVAEVKPNPKNPNHHPEEQIELLAKIIKTQGWRAPVTVSTLSGLVVRGHGRLMAAKFLGLDCVPVDFQHYQSNDAELADLLADNKIAELAEIDSKMLADVFQDINPDSIDIDITGYSEEEYLELTSLLAESLHDETVADPDTVPEPPKNPVTKLGDIWQIGRHRLMCGSSTNPDDVDTLMNGKKAQMLFTSPPYSDMREYEGGKNLDVDNVATFISAYKNYTDYQCVNLGIQRKNHAIYRYWDKYIELAENTGYKLMAWNVWDKLMCGSIGQQSAFFPIRHEWIFVFGTEFFEINQTWEKKEASIREAKPRLVRQTDGSLKATSTGDMTNKYKQMESVLPLYAELGDVRSLHPATFPVQLPSEYVQALSSKNDIVIEPFCGSGTTLIACEQLDRICYAMELEPKYCDVIVNRYASVTGKKDITLIRNGKKIAVAETGVLD